MQLNNVKKKVLKSADKIGIPAGETVLAACTTNPSGTMKRMMAKELVGIVGAIAADRTTKDAPEGGGLAEDFPSGQHYLILTDQRLLVTSVAAMSGKPKELKAEWPIDDIAAIGAEPGKLAIPLSIAFADGSAVQLEGARGTGADTVPGAFQELTGAAAT